MKFKDLLLEKNREYYIEKNKGIEQFKVGDKVKILSNDGGAHHDIGAIGEIKRIELDQAEYDCPIYVTAPGIDDTGRFESHRKPLGGIAQTPYSQA